MGGLLLDTTSTKGNLFSMSLSWKQV